MRTSGLRPGFEDTGAQVLLRCTLWRPLGLGVLSKEGSKSQSATAEDASLSESSTSGQISSGTRPNDAADSDSEDEEQKVPGTGSKRRRQGARLQTASSTTGARDEAGVNDASRRAAGPRKIWEEPPLAPLGRIVLITRWSRDGHDSELGRALQAVATVNSELLSARNAGRNPIPAVDDPSSASGQIADAHASSSASSLGTSSNSPSKQTATVSALQVYDPTDRERLQLQAADPFFDGITGV